MNRGYGSTGRSAAQLSHHRAARQRQRGGEEPRAHPAGGDEASPRARSGARRGAARARGARRTAERGGCAARGLRAPRRRSVRGLSHGARGAGAGSERATLDRRGGDHVRAAVAAVAARVSAPLSGRGRQHSHRHEPGRGGLGRQCRRGPRLRHLRAAPLGARGQAAVRRGDRARGRSGTGARARSRSSHCRSSCSRRAAAFASTWSSALSRAARPST